MPIFDMYGGRPNIYTENETDRINNPEKYNYDQAQYDAFIASLDAKVASRQAVDERSREVIPTSYANFGTGGTNPGFSLAGRAGHTSGGLAGNAGTAQYADGGIVQHMQLGEWRLRMLILCQRCPTTWRLCLRTIRGRKPVLWDRRSKVRDPVLWAA